MQKFYKILKNIGELIALIIIFFIKLVIFVFMIFYSSSQTGDLDILSLPLENVFESSSKDDSLDQALDSYYKEIGVDKSKSKGSSFCDILTFQEIFALKDIIAVQKFVLKEFYGSNLNATALFKAAQIEQFQKIFGLHDAKLVSDVQNKIQKISLFNRWYYNINEFSNFRASIKDNNYFQAISSKNFSKMDPATFAIVRKIETARLGEIQEICINSWEQAEKLELDIEKVCDKIFVCSDPLELNELYHEKKLKFQCLAIEKQKSVLILDLEKTYVERQAVFSKVELFRKLYLYNLSKEL